MKLVDIAVTRPVTIWMFTLGILLFGLVAAGRLAVNLLPDLSYPSLTVRTEFIGAAPAEVEQLVSKPIEEAVGIVKGVRKVQSVSRSGRSDVVMEFDWGTDMDLAALEVREKLDVLFLPLEIEKPLLLRFNPNLDPIVRLALSRENAGEALNPAQLVSLRTFAEEDLRRALESLPGVAAVRPDGGLSQEIQILVDPQKLSQLQLDISQISDRLRQENLNQAGGRLETPSYDYLVRTINQFADLAQIENLYLAQVNGSQVRLKDVAQVRDSFVDRQSITYVNGKEAIEVAIYKEGDANTVQVAQTLLSQLPQLEKALPAGYKLTLVYDQSEFIKQAIDDVKSAAVVGGLLAMLVLFSLYVERILGARLCLSSAALRHLANLIGICAAQQGCVQPPDRSGNTSAMASTASATSTRRRFWFMAIWRRVLWASASLRLRCAISRPLARSTSLRSLRLARTVSSSSLTACRRRAWSCTRSRIERSSCTP